MKKLFRFHTQEFIDGDMLSMYDIIKDLSIYDWKHIGAEGEVAHSENGTSRSWNPWNEILVDVIPFVSVLQKGQGDPTSPGRRVKR